MGFPELSSNSVGGRLGPTQAFFLKQDVTPLPFSHPIHHPESSWPQVKAQGVSQAGTALTLVLGRSSVEATPHTPRLRQIQLKFPHLPGGAAQLLAGSGVAPSGRCRARRGAGRWLAVDADSLERGHLGNGSLELFCTAQRNCIRVRAQDSEVGDLGHNGFAHLLMDPYIH